MKRSRAFILSEQLLTIMLQAGFILILCTSFYQLISFYTRTQQVLTARSHAERVISFMDDKIRNAGLGLWRCGSSSEIRGKFGGNIGMLATYTTDSKGYKLPIALKWNDNKLETSYTNDVPSLSPTQDSGDVVTVLYAVKDLSSMITAFKEAVLLPPLINGSLSSYNEYVSGNVTLLDTDSFSKLKDAPMFGFPSGGSGEGNIKRYAVMEGLGYPIHLNDKSGSIYLKVFGLTNPSSEDLTIPAAGELMGLNCMQMFVQGEDGKDEGRQFAFRELASDGNWENKKYNQEKGILDIYMKIDRSTNIFTLWVLASGGYDASLNNPRPETWPDNANPRLDTAGNPQSPEDAKTAWLNSSYRHHVVYVSRASWKLNNIPQNFTWD